MNTLQHALSELTLADVWELAPDNSPASIRDGLITSPFRADRKPSFSIFDGQRRWKDHGEAGKAGGVWQFVQRCRPDWSRQEIARYLCERAGLEFQESRKSAPSSWKRRAERLERARSARERLFKNREMTVPPPKTFQPWPDFVRDHFLSADCGDDLALALAEKRGWPVEWVQYLVEAALLRWPTLPWNAKRFPAFTVGLFGKEPIGYHQRCYFDVAGPAWIYVPYHPQQPRNEFMRRLADIGDGGQVSPLPVVLGNPEYSSLWVILEGQWDAITFNGAIGGFHDAFDLPITVFGLRGAQAGPLAFLAYYGDIIKRLCPYVWLMPDNDRAGQSWDGKGRTSGFGHLAQANFVQAVRKLLPPDCQDILVSRVPPRIGKDFNDFWKEARPSADQIFHTLHSCFANWPN